MGVMKGLMPGRGMTETTRVTWLNTLLQCTAVISQLRKVTGLTDAAKEHVDVTRAPMKHDVSDPEKLTRFFSTNSPFR